MTQIREEEPKMLSKLAVMAVTLVLVSATVALAGHGTVREEGNESTAVELTQVVPVSLVPVSATPAQIRHGTATEEGNESTAVTPAYVAPSSAVSAAPWLIDDRQGGSRIH